MDKHGNTALEWVDGSGAETINWINHVQLSIEIIFN